MACSRKETKTMNCFYCKGELEHTHAAFIVEMDSCIIVIKNVPTDSCSKCGQKSYSDSVAAQIEDTVNRLRNTITEIAVVHYPENNVA